jgi:hypothetical protein
MTESKTMQELHKIREKIYEEEKNLSIEERIKKTREESEKILQEYNIKLRRVNSKNKLSSAKKSA